MKRRILASAAAVLAGIFSLSVTGCYQSGNQWPPPPGPPPNMGHGKLTGTDADFRGMRLGKARNLAKKRRLISRIVEKDGVEFPVTMDYLVNRVNFVVARGTVVSVSRG